MAAKPRPAGSPDGGGVAPSLAREPKTRVTSREGFIGQFYFGQHSDVQVVTQHGWDNAWFGQGYGDFIDGVAPLNNTPASLRPTGELGARSPTWNGVLVEPHYVYSPQLIFLARYETIRMSQQATAGTPSNLGNITTYTVGYRYNPFMTSRAGFAWHNEYNCSTRTEHRR